MLGFPLSLRIAAAAVLVVSTAVAFWGRPPRARHSPGAWRRLAVVAAACYAGGAAALLLDAPLASAAFVALGVEVLCLAAWLGRGIGEDGGTDDDAEDDEDGGSRGPHHGPQDTGGWGGEGGPGRWGPQDDRAFSEHVARRRVARHEVSR